jgi:hypothetical protein
MHWADVHASRSLSSGEDEDRSILAGQRCTHDNLPAGIGLCLVVALPLLVWMFLDKDPFGGDQSIYASATLDLYRSQALGPSPWADAMISSMGYKAPGIAWLGQWFVPLGGVLGSVDAALMLSIVATQAVTLLLIFGTLWTLSGKSSLVPLAGCMLVAAGPLFQLLSHQYLVEPLQLLAVAWFVLIMSRAPHWTRAFTLAQLVLATSVAMLAKISSPLYCVGPAVVTLAFLPGISPARTAWAWGRPATVLAWIVAIPLGIGAVCWYYQNIALTLLHVRMATSGPVAAVWGKEDTFLHTLAYWIGGLGNSLFVTPSLVLAIFIVVAGIAGYLSRPDRRMRYFTLCCIVSILQITLVLVSFSFASNREARYLLALLPYVALIVGWGISYIGRPAARVLAAGVFCCIWAAVSGHGLHLFDISSRAFGPLPRVNADVRRAAMMREIVARTCADANQTPYYNIVAVDPSLMGDWLAPAPADYVAAREHLHSQRATPCSYGYVGDGFFGNDAASSWASVLEKKPRYIVTFDPSVYPPADDTYNQALNKHNFPILFERLSASGDFEVFARLSGDPGILIFRASGLR